MIDLISISLKASFIVLAIIYPL